MTKEKKVNKSKVDDKRKACLHQEPSESESFEFGGDELNVYHKCTKCGKKLMDSYIFIKRVEV